MECSACDFWDIEKTPDHGKSPDYCLCLKAVPSWSGDDSPMLVEDGSMYMAELFTHKDHYCSSFKEKEK